MCTDDYSQEIQRAPIRADRQALISLIERLESPLPVLPEGVAIAELLMSDRHRPSLVRATERRGADASKWLSAQSI